MKKLKEKFAAARGGYYLFLVIVGVFMLGLNLMDVPTLSDDMVYRFVWPQSESSEVMPISSLGDLFYSQWIHYQSVNGRFLVHFLAQGFMAFLPPVVLQVLNSLFFVLLLHLCHRWVVGNGRPQLFVPIVSCFLLFVIFQGFRTAMLWGLGALNYLWSLVAVMTFLLSLRHMERPNGWLRASLLLLALVAGWSHEALSLPVSLAFAAYLFMNRKRQQTVALAPYMMVFMGGTALCLLSPGIWNRAADGVTLSGRLLSGAICLITNVRVFWILIVGLVVTWVKQRPVVEEHFSAHAYMYVALFTAMGIVCLCGTNLERVAFFADFVSMLLLLALIQRVVTPVVLRYVETICCVLMLIIYVPVFIVRHENSESWRMAERQMKAPGCEYVAVHLPETTQCGLMDYFRGHYVNSSFEFGFYCVYMAFDASDINMRCAARLFGKERLAFLPADVLECIDADTLAYTHCQLDRQQNLYVWKMPKDSPVTQLRFMLKDEDISKLSLLQRLLAYDADFYDLDDFHYEMLRINNRPYLVFTRPTSNIFRRTDHLEIHLGHE